MRSSFLIALLLMIATAASSQAQVSSQTQITQARDYVGSLLSQMSTGLQAGQFSASADYADAGPALQKKIEVKLTQFKLTMNAMAIGSLGRSIEQYNQLARDTSISESEKTERLNILFKSLEVQASAASATYHAALASLYTLEPSWTVVDYKQNSPIGRIGLGVITLGFLTESNGTLGERNGKYIFADGSVQRRGNSTSLQIVQNRIRNTLVESCRSKICQSSLLADYSYYFSSVIAQLDRDLNIVLADGKTVKVSNKSDHVSIEEAISTFSFDNEKFRSLPESI